MRHKKEHHPHCLQGGVLCESARSLGGNHERGFFQCREHVVGFVGAHVIRKDEPEALCRAMRFECDSRASFAQCSHKRNQLRVDDAAVLPLASCRPGSVDRKEFPSPDCLGSIFVEHVHSPTSWVWGLDCWRVLYITKQFLSILC